MAVVLSGQKKGNRKYAQTWMAIAAIAVSTITRMRRSSPGSSQYLWPSISRRWSKYLLKTAALRCSDSSAASHDAVPKGLKQPR